MAMIHIETVAISANNIVGIYFSSIPQTYKDLLIVLNGRSQQSVTSERIFSYIGTPSAAPLRSGYFLRAVQGDGININGSSQSNDTQWNINHAVTGSSATSNTFSSVSMYFPNYTDSQVKTISFEGVVENNGTLAGLTLAAGSTSGTGATSPITFIALEVLNTSFYATLSSASLYGIS